MVWKIWLYLWVFEKWKFTLIFWCYIGFAYEWGSLPRQKWGWNPSFLDVGDKETHIFQNYKTTLEVRSFKRFYINSTTFSKIGFRKYHDIPSPRLLYTIYHHHHHLRCCCHFSSLFNLIDNVNIKRCMHGHTNDKNEFDRNVS